MEEIVGDRYNKRRKRHEWLIKWKNFRPEQNTWEPIENLTNAMEILDEYRGQSNPITVASTFFLPCLHPPPLANAFLATLSLL